jgi:predicted nuclease with RNAse H fold
MTGSSVYIGIDPTAGRRPMNYAVLDDDLRLLAGSAGGLADVLAVVLAYPSAVVAIDAPQGPNGGLMARPEHRERLGLAPHTRSWSGYKVCEYELRRRGIGLYSTPVDAAAAPGWMQVGFRLFAELRAAGFTDYDPHGPPAPRRVLEVHPHACYTVLLGRVPLRKDSLEGRLQRQLVLYREGLDIANPMDTLEELTPHHLLSGTLELPGLFDHDALDALAAAYTAWLAGHHPERTTALGDRDEGCIIVPIAASDLRDHYPRASTS